MLVDESAPALSELDTPPPGGESAGLYIKDKNNEFIKIDIPRDCIAFQMGEASQVSSKGLLVATPHLVKGVESKSVARNTFAVFMQPNVREMLTESVSYGMFSEEVFKRHYG